MSNTPIIRVENLVNRFGKQVVHDNLSFDIEAGEIIGIVGGSGSGKSVLMRSIIGLHQPNEGNITVRGKKITSTGKPPAGVFGVLFQHGALFSALTVEQNVMVPLKECSALKEEECEALSRLKISLVGPPPEAAEKYPSQLSGGMIKRASLARAMALDPPILFLDEPTAGLDPIGANDFDLLIKQLHRSLGVTVIIITHDLDTLFTLCTRVAVLVDKRIILDTIPNLMQSDHPWIKSYFHGPRARAAMQDKEY